MEDSDIGVEGMYCAHCGKEITEGNKFCTGCGASVINDAALGAEASVGAAVSSKPSIQLPVEPVISNETTIVKKEKNPIGIVIGVLVGIVVVLICIIGIVSLLTIGSKKDTRISDTESVATEKGNYEDADEENIEALDTEDAVVSKEIPDLSQYSDVPWLEMLLYNNSANYIMPALGVEPKNVSYTSYQEYLQTGTRVSACLSYYDTEIGGDLMSTFDIYYLATDPDKTYLEETDEATIGSISFQVDSCSKERAEAYTRVIKNFNTNRGVFYKFGKTYNNQVSYKALPWGYYQVTELEDGNYVVGMGIIFANEDDIQEGSLYEISKEYYELIDNADGIDSSMLYASADELKQKLGDKILNDTDEYLSSWGDYEWLGFNSDALEISLSSEYAVVNCIPANPNMWYGNSVFRNPDYESENSELSQSDEMRIMNSEFEDAATSEANHYVNARESNDAIKNYLGWDGEDGEKDITYAELAGIIGSPGKLIYMDANVLEVVWKNPNSETIVAAVFELRPQLRKKHLYSIFASDFHEDFFMLNDDVLYNMKCRFND